VKNIIGKVIKVICAKPIHQMPTDKKKAGKEPSLIFHHSAS
jgi:hypothetical protein